MNLWPSRDLERETLLDWERTLRFFPVERLFRPSLLARLRRLRDDRTFEVRPNAVSMPNYPSLNLSC